MFRENVQVVKNQNNSNKLFEKWNTKNQKNIKCSNDDCNNDANDNAYIVTKIGNIDKKFIIKKISPMLALVGVIH